MNLKTFRECVEGGQLFSSSLSGGDVAGISPTTYVVLHTLNSKLFKGDGMGLGCRRRGLLNAK